MCLYLERLRALACPSKISPGVSCVQGGDPPWLGGKAGKPLLELEPLKAAVKYQQVTRKEKNHFHFGDLLVWDPRGLAPLCLQAGMGNK